MLTRDQFMEEASDQWCMNDWSEIELAIEWVYDHLLKPYENDEGIEFMVLKDYEDLHPPTQEELDARWALKRAIQHQQAIQRIRDKAERDGTPFEEVEKLLP